MNTTGREGSPNIIDRWGYPEHMGMARQGENPRHISSYSQKRNFPYIDKDRASNLTLPMP